MKKKSKEKIEPLNPSDLHLVPPDGKFGWVIVIAYAIANVSIEKYFFLFFFRKKKKLYKETLNRAITFILSVLVVYSILKNH